MIKRNRCKGGKSCGSSCINRDKVCKKEMPAVAKAVSKYANLITLKARGEADGAVTAAREVLAKYKKYEPRITMLMQQLSKKFGGELVGLEHKLKDEASLTRKINSEKNEFGGDYRKTARSMSDVNRYTMKLPTSNYSQTVKEVLRELKREGYKVRIKNYWSPNAGPYRGINVALESRGGIKTELQFHTEASLQAKKKGHGLYKQYRVSEDPRERRILWEQMIEIANNVGVPPKAPMVGRKRTLKRVEFKTDGA